jgi:sorting nexin-8
MSLFGDSSPNNRSLFASPSFSGSPSLFDDEHNSNGSGLDSGGTPWDNDVAIASHSSSRISSTRLANPNDVAAILLTAENAVIPSAYYDIYEKLVNEFGGSDGAVQAHGVERVFDEAAVYGEERRRIWDVVVGMKESVGRGEVWCLLAMVGLVREGEDEVNVDSVDDRRMSEFLCCFFSSLFFSDFKNDWLMEVKDLPVPVLKDLMPEPKKQEPLQTPPPESYGNNVVLNQNRNIHTQSAQELPTADKPTFVARQQSTPISTTPVRARNTGTLLSSSVDDPWGSVTTPTAAPHRPPSQQVLQQPPPQPHHFPAQADGVASAGDEEADNEPDDIHAALRNTGPSRATTSSTWGGDNFGSGENYSQGTMGFGDHPGLGARHGSFGGLGGNRLNGNLQGPMDSNRLNAGLERIKEAMKAPEEHVVVNMLPEKEGLFMFQHRNYQVASSRRGSRVVRRYSDFVW